MIAVHLAPSISISIASVLAVLIVLYAWFLGRAEVPAPRRKIRRMSLIVMLATLPVLVRALSFINPSIQPTQYVVSWLIVLAAMIILIFLAIFDVFITAHVHAREQEARIRRDAPDLFKKLQREMNRKREGDHHA